MPKYTVTLSKSAARQLDKFTEATRKPILSAIGKLAANPRPFGYKKLKSRDGLRIRIGNYRVIYLDVGHRREIYQ